MTVVSNTQALKNTIHLSLDELAEDAKRYLDLLEQFRQAEEGSEVYEDLSAEVEVQVTVLQVHASSLNELIDELDDTLIADE